MASYLLDTNLASKVLDGQQLLRQRLLSTLCLYRAGYDFKRLFTIGEYYDRGRSAFYRAIQSLRESGMDLTGCLGYFPIPFHLPARTHLSAQAIERIVTNVRRSVTEGK